MVMSIKPIIKQEHFNQIPLQNLVLTIQKSLYVQLITLLMLVSMLEVTTILKQVLLSAMTLALETTVYAENMI